MLVIPSTAAQLRIALTAAVAANQPIIYTTWADVDPDGSPAVFTPGASAMSANGTADVTAIGGAGSTAQQRIVKYVSVSNRDTAASTVRFKYYDGTTSWTIKEVVLDSGDSVEYAENTWKVVDSNGNEHQVIGTNFPGGMDTLRPTYGAGGQNADYYAGFMTPSTFTNCVQSLGVIRALPFFAPARLNPQLNYCAINILTAGTGTTSARLAIYKSVSLSDNLMPGTLIWDSGDIATNSTGIKGGTLGSPVTLVANQLYWACYNQGNASATARGFNAFTDLGTTPLGYTTGIAANVPFRVVTATYAYAAYPTNFPACALTTATANNLPVIALRF